MAKKKKELKLTSEEMLKLQLHAEEVRAADCIIQLKASQRDLLLKEIDPAGKLTALVVELRNASDKFAAAKRKTQELTSLLEKKLGIKLAEYGYDEETGLLTKLDL